MPISKRRKGKHAKESQEQEHTTAGKGKHAQEQPQQHTTTAGTSSPSTCKEFSRRHMFALGIGIQIVSSSLSGWSPAVDKMVLFASVVSLLTVLLGLLSEKIKNIHLETNETRLHQRRWFFLLGLGLSTFISLHRAQRFGLLFHGSSYYLPHAPQLKLARRFRNIVYSRNYRNQHMSSSDLAKTLLPPTEGLLLAGIAVEQDVQTTTTTDIEFLTALGEYFKNDESLLPSALHANSVVTPFVAVDSRNGNSNNNDGDNNDNNNDNNNNNKGSDVVLMVFGGILSEFIDNGAFESMFHLNSTFEQEWKETLSKIQDRTLSHDQVFSLDALANVEKPMLELFHATSVEGKQRNSAPEFRILRYSPPFGSCDSIGTISSSSTGWLRRMSKIHTILTQEMHLNPRYTFVGYSRGALVALDVLGRGQRRLDAHPWVHDVSAVVSVGGPLFGAEGADSIDLPGHVFYDLVKPIKQFAARLDYEHEGDAGSLGHAKEILKNSYEFLKLGWELASVDQHKGKSKNSLRAEQLFSKECGEAGVPLPSLSIVTDGLKKLLVDQFDILIPVGKYYENIKRAKLMLTSMLDGIKDLSTESRLKWWHNKQNQLPKHIALFSIPATMPEAGESVEKLDQSVLYASASTSTDWWANRMFYYAAYGDTGKQCQDGQVSCDRAIFWPQMMQRCGWDMEGRETGVLAVVGSHHWGLALPYALDGVPSHLPRGALLDAIGAMFVEREHKKEKWYM